MKARCAVHQKAKTSSSGNHNGIASWASIVLILGPNGQTVLVLDTKQKKPRWKLPGGKREDVDKNSPRATAAREVFEETGIVIPLQDLQLIKRVDKTEHQRPHILFVYLADVKNFDGLLKRGDEGEYVKKFALSMIPRMKSFFAKHWMHIKNVYASAEALT